MKRSDDIEEVWWTASSQKDFEKPISTYQVFTRSKVRSMMEI